MLVMIIFSVFLVIMLFLIFIRSGRVIQLLEEQVELSRQIRACCENGCKNTASKESE